MDNVDTQGYDADALAATLTGCISIEDSDDESCRKQDSSCLSSASLRHADKTLNGAGTSPASLKGEAAAPATKRIEEFPSEVRAEVKACLAKAGNMHAGTD